MRFYKEHHQFYIGIDLHARTMYVCIMNTDGDVVFHMNMAATPECLEKVVAQYGTDMFLADAFHRLILDMEEEIQRRQAKT